MPTIGPVTTSTRTVGVKYDIDDVVDILTPADVPLQQLLPTDTTNEIKVEWIEDALLGQVFTAGTVSGTGPWVSLLADTSEVRVGDIYIATDSTDSSKQWWVSAITTNTNVTLTAVGGHTTAPVSGTVYQLAGQYLGEGLDPLAARSQERTTKYNYTQIMQEAVKASRTARHRGARGGMYGVGDPYDNELEKRFKELAIRFERQLLHGQRTQSGDFRTMGGLFYYITTNATSGLKANVRTLLDDAILKGYNKGGSGHYTLVVSPTIKGIIDSVDASLRPGSKDIGTSAGYTITSYMSSFGEVTVVPDRHMPRTRGLVLQTEYTNIVNFDPWTHEVLAKTGDADQGQIVAEKTLRVKNEIASGTFTLTDA